MVVGEGCVLSTVHVVVAAGWGQLYWHQSCAYSNPFNGVYCGQWQGVAPWVGFARAEVESRVELEEPIKPPPRPDMMAYEECISATLSVFSGNCTVERYVHELYRVLTGSNLEMESFEGRKML